MDHQSHEHHVLAFTTYRLTALLDAFYRRDSEGVSIDWRQVLDGEELLLRICDHGSPDERIERVTYQEDQVTQLAPPRVFDPVRCAGRLNQAIQSEGGSYEVF